MLRNMELEMPENIKVLNDKGNLLIILLDGISMACEI